MRYEAEGALHFRSIDRFLHRASDLPDLRDREFQGLLDRVQQCHIYLIGKRPRVSIVPASVQASSESVNLDVSYHAKGVERRFPIGLPRHLFDPREVGFEAGPFPHRELVSRDRDGRVFAETLLANHIHIFEKLPAEVRDVEILYVGKGTAQSASDRLESHSTLQRILGDVSAADPEGEVFIFLYSFEFKKPLLATREALLDCTRDAHIRDMRAYQPTLRDKISLVEASCIGYFRPPYNTQLLNFPAADLSALGAVRSADFALILVDLDNDPIGGVRIFSSAVAPASYHSFRVDLRENSITSVFGSATSGAGRL
jgi:uncharacterized protein